jgi:hypothetical protein
MSGRVVVAVVRSCGERAASEHLQPRKRARGLLSFACRHPRASAKGVGARGRRGAQNGVHRLYVDNLNEARPRECVGNGGRCPPVVRCEGGRRGSGSLLSTSQSNLSRFHQQDLQISPQKLLTSNG